MQILGIVGLIGIRRGENPPPVNSPEATPNMPGTGWKQRTTDPPLCVAAPALPMFCREFAQHQYFLRKSGRQ